MSYGLTIDLSGPGLGMPARVLGVLQPARIRPVVGRAAVISYRAHLRAKNASSPNALGGRRTNYYAAAARSTSFALVGDDAVVVSIAQIGIRQRFFGGTIKPKTAKFLTIPAHPLAHGKRAREFPDLELVFGARGQPIALAQKAQGTRRFGLILFRLVRSVTQRPDPSVLPELSAVGAAIAAAVASTVDRAARREGGSASANPSANPPAA